MKMKWFSFSVLLCFAVAVSADSVFPAGDFEEWKPSAGTEKNLMKRKDLMTPVGWRCTGVNAKIEKEEAIKYSGKASAKITISPKEWSELLYYPFPVKGNTKYEISFRVRGENVVYQDSKQFPWGGMQASPSETNPWKDKKGELVFVRKKGTFDWCEFKKSFVTRPNDKVALIRFSLPQGSGTLWLDDFRILEEKSAK